MEKNRAHEGDAESHSVIFSSVCNIVSKVCMCTHQTITVFTFEEEGEVQEGGQRWTFAFYSIVSPNIVSTE